MYLLGLESPQDKLKSDSFSYNVAEIVLNDQRAVSCLAAS